jgi:hypothetical protein
MAISPKPAHESGWAKEDRIRLTGLLCLFFSAMDYDAFPAGDLIRQGIEDLW